VWLVREKEAETSYVLSVLDKGVRRASHYLLTRSTRADGSYGAHWIVNNRVRLAMCRSINECIQVLQSCPFTSKRVWNTANQHGPFDGPLLHPARFARLVATLLPSSSPSSVHVPLCAAAVGLQLNSTPDECNHYDMNPPRKSNAASTRKSARNTGSRKKNASISKKEKYEYMHVEVNRQRQQQQQRKAAQTASTTG